MKRTILVLIAVLLLAGVSAPALAVHFVHEFHLDNVDDIVCVNCHLPSAKEIKPKNDVCLSCHDEEDLEDITFARTRTHGLTWVLDHKQAAKGKLFDCAKCHEQDRQERKSCLECHKGLADEKKEIGTDFMINIHRSDFHVTHPIAARTNPQLCSSCHETKFCSDCHDDFAPADLAVKSHRRGWSGLRVSGGELEHGVFPDTSCLECHADSVLPSHKWASSHAKEARKNLVTCQACHPQGEVCLTCHSTKSGLGINPHPDNWDKIKGKLEKAGNRKTCRKCH